MTPFPLGENERLGFCGQFGGGVPPTARTLSVCGVVDDRLVIVTVTPGGNAMICDVCSCVYPLTVPQTGSFSTPIFPVGMPTPIPPEGNGEGVPPPPLLMLPRPPPFVHAAAAPSATIARAIASFGDFTAPAASLLVPALRSSPPPARCACLPCSGSSSRSNTCRLSKA